MYETTQHDPAASRGVSASAGPKDSFLGALFDLTFTKFVTVGFVKVIYILGIIAVALMWLIFSFAAFDSSVGQGFATLLLGWIPALLAILFMRVSVEFTVATVRTAQNTATIAQNSAYMAGSVGVPQR